MEFEVFNQHWKQGHTYDYPLRRMQYEVLVKYLSTRQILAITGLRRTGKTTLVKQLINQLIKEGVNRQHLLYFSFDEEKPRITDLLQEYATITGADLAKDQLYIFLDEVQKLKDWQEQVKVYYDHSPNLKFIVTGSQTLFLKGESLAGRIYTITIPPLTFKEYLLFKGVESLFPREMQRELTHYQRTGFIELINEDEERIKFYHESIMNKVLYEDIPQRFPVENPEKLKALFQAIYAHPGMIIKYDSIGDDIGLSYKTVEKYLSYLIEAKLVKKLYNFSPNFLTSEKKLKRFYVTTASFCYLRHTVSESLVAENLVAAQHDFFWRDTLKREVDCIEQQDSKPHPIEVKYKEKISKRDSSGLLAFMKKYDVKTGTVITKNYEEEHEWDGRQIKCIPLWKWLLEQQPPNDMSETHSSRTSSKTEYI